MVLSAIATSAYAVLAGPLIAAFRFGEEPAQSQPSTDQIDLLSSLGWQAIVAGLVGIAVLRSAAELARAQTVSAVQQGVVRDLREGLFHHVLNLTPQGLERWGRGELAARLNSEIQGVRAFLHLGLVGGLRNLLVATALATVAFKMDTRVASWGALALPLAAISVTWAGARLRQAQRRLYESEADAAAITAEAAGGASVLQAYGAQDWAAKKMARTAGDAERYAVRAERLVAIAPSVIELTAAVGIAAAWWAAQGVAGTLPEARSISAVAAVVLLFRPLMGLSSALFGLVAGLACIDRIDQLLGVAARADQQVVEPRLRHPSLTARSVRFSYGEHRVLDCVDLSLSSGESVAIIGPSGAGKTTLLEVLAGVRRPASGEIVLTEGEARRRGPAELRRACAWMPQQSVLFADTVLTNITLGDGIPNRARAKVAARAACAHRFVVARGGYEATILEGGADLSAGQRQRLCLARAFYRGAPILLLDEPTAAADADVEAAFIAECHRLKRAGAVIVIATHRSSIARAADRVLELREGRLIEKGEGEWEGRLDTFSKSA